MTKAQEYQDILDTLNDTSLPIACKARLDAVQDLTLFYTQNRALIAEALAFRERKDAIRGAIEALKQEGRDYEPALDNMRNFHNATIDEVLVVFDREAK